ncbi:hypothetical protein [Microtetraspora malaysiensis]|uniref:hypothetical protein n=1 Tax=Microtetraspora malaysiensis TaxID=161358 RepID=UPI00082B2A9C|nr:hypothetical protein [Microtetraspora malaysiensis]
MPNVLGRVRRPTHRLTLNTDGKPHTLENALAVSTLVVGLLALVTGFVVSLHPVASWVGTIGFCGGLYAQYVSVTTPQRSLIIIGIVGSFVGAALGIAHGGFLPTH